MAVNYEYLFQLGYGTREEIAACEDAYPCDPDAGDFLIIVRPGMWLRLTRNLDKDRGFLQRSPRPCPGTIASRT